MVPALIAARKATIRQRRPISRGRVRQRQSEGTRTRSGATREGDGTGWWVSVGVVMIAARWLAVQRGWMRTVA
jgi:hypothetical protein